MTEQQRVPSAQARDRARLRGRIGQFHRHFGRGNWPKCYEYLDPRLRDGAKVEYGAYAKSLAAFREYYGPVQIDHIRLSIHPGGRNTKRDPRDFAYAYVFRKDNRHAFHLFRERWVKEGGTWYTRVAGLVVRETADGG